MFLLCHLWLTTTNLSYRFPIREPPPPCAVLLVRITIAYNTIHSIYLSGNHESETKPRKPRQFEKKSYVNSKTEGSATFPWQRLGRQSERLLPVAPTWTLNENEKNETKSVRPMRANLACYMFDMSTNPTWSYASYAMIQEVMKSIQAVPKLTNAGERKPVRWCAILCRPLGIRINVAQLITLLWFRHGLTMNELGLLGAHVWIQKRIGRKNELAISILFRDCLSQIPNATCLKPWCCGSRKTVPSLSSWLYDEQYSLQVLMHMHQRPGKIKRNINDKLISTSEITTNNSLKERDECFSFCHLLHIVPWQLVPLDRKRGSTVPVDSWWLVLKQIQGKSCNGRRVECFASPISNYFCFTFILFICFSYSIHFITLICSKCMWQRACFRSKVSSESGLVSLCHKPRLFNRRLCI